MSKSFRKAALVATMLSLPLFAEAQSMEARVQGLYVGTGVGTNYLQRSSDSSPDLKIGTQWGFGGVLSLGYGFGNGLRLELEGSYRQNDGDAIRYGAPIGRLSRVSGSASSYGAMVNVLYDFDLGPLVPYIGAGAGYQIHSHHRLRGISAGGDRITLDDEDGAFAYQFIAGLGLPIESVPGLVLTAEYRFMGTFGHDMNGIRIDAGNTLTRFSYDASNLNHSLLIGVRYNFGRAPQALPPPAVAPAPARTFLVFFDWDSAELTARARQIIAEAAQARTRQAVTRIEVNGHTDTSGAPQYNQRLSERRAAAVAAELIRLGVPREEIITRGFGETQLLIATPDNVREPQNRRVEIILR